jgi:hypothetical protein
MSFGLIIFLSLFLSSNKDVESIPEKPLLTATTGSVIPPDQVELFGTKIDLRRFDMRERYDREINSFAYFHSTTMMYIKRANKYFPIIEPILKANGIPDDFKYLAVIESNLDIRSVSPAKAVGIWQLMTVTGRENGLEINDQIDERYHLEKATEAACRYLKTAYSRYGDWFNVAASYNAGMARISSELKNQMVSSSFDLLLVEETSRYLFRIMAIKELFSNPYKYGFVLKPENLYQPVSTNKVEISQDIPDLAEFAQSYGLNYRQLKEFNPWLRDRKLKISTSGKKYILDIPEKKDLFYDRSKIKVHDNAWVS